MAEPNKRTQPPSSPDTTTQNQEPWSVESVLSTLPHPPPTNPTTPIPFLHLLQRLKTTKREGWRRFGILNGESISDHMYRMSIITMLPPSPLSSRLNIPHCTKMALVHDMAESLVGDITPVDGVSREEKNRREGATMEFLTKRLLGSGVESGTEVQGEGLRRIWEEYEEAETLEARFVHDVDKIELLLQMVEYERSRGEGGGEEDGGGLDLSEFMGVARKIYLDETKVWADEILREREAFWKEKEKEKGEGKGKLR